MTEDYEDIDNIVDSIEERRPIFVDAKGEIHDADKVREAGERGEVPPQTQFKPTTWY